MYFEILDVYSNYKDQRINGMLASIVRDYQIKSEKVRESDIEKRKKQSVFSSYFLDEPRKVYEDYICKLSNFLDILEHYLDIINEINDCKNNKSNSDSELVKEIKDFKDLCKSLGKSIYSKYVNLLNSELDIVKNNIVKDILKKVDKKTDESVDKDFIYENYEEFELTIRKGLQILKLCCKYNDQRIDDKLSSIVKEYQEKSKKDTNDDSNEGMKYGIFSSFSINNHKEVYEDYIKKISNFSYVLEHYLDIIDTIKECKEDSSDCDNEFVKDIHEFKNICKSFGDEFYSKYLNILNKELDNIKENIIQDILMKTDIKKDEYDSNYFVYESYEIFELSFRHILHKLLTKVNEESKLLEINKEIEFKKLGLNTKINSKQDALRLDLRNIQEIVEYIESITQDKDILDKLKKFKNIRLDLDKNIDENIKYVYGLLKEIIKIKLEVEYVYDPMKYKSRL